MKGTTPPSTAPERASCEAPSLSEAATSTRWPCFLGLPEQGYALDEVALGPETEDLELDHLPGARVAQCKVWDERRFPLGEGQHIASPFELPAARILRAFPGPDERPADIVGLALVLRPQVVTLQS